VCACVCGVCVGACVGACVSASACVCMCVVCVCVCEYVLHCTNSHKHTHAHIQQIYTHTGGGGLVGGVLRSGKTAMKTALQGFTAVFAFFLVPDRAAGMCRQESKRWEKDVLHRTEGQRLCVCVCVYVRAWVAILGRDVCGHHLTPKRLSVSSRNQSTD